MTDPARLFPGEGRVLGTGEVVVNNGFAQPPAPPREVIDEDFLLCKILTLIPLIGIIPQICQETSLGEQVVGMFIAPTNQRKIALLELKNEYKILGMVRDLLTIALVITEFALGILPLISVLFVTLIEVTFNAFFVWPALSHNRELIAQLRTDNPPQRILIR